MRSGKALKLEEYLARWADPPNRLAGMSAVGQNVQAVAVPSRCYMYWAELKVDVPFARKVNDTMAEYCSGAPDGLMD